MKALGGCFLIDDFGRQFVSPRDLLNRWIVPMESRVDYLKLRSGASFSIPFEEIVIFATNLNPEDLMDPAFLRRLPYKIEVGPPGLDQFHRIFQMECARHNLTLSDEVFSFIVYMITKEKELELAGFQPTFIVEQVTATCRFLGKDPELKSPYVEYAVNNLRVRRNTEPRMERTQHSVPPEMLAEGKKPVDSANVFQDIEIKQSTGLV
jgi:SpoVK/Ycf46/Vps4 family AAA+-type ATPase